MSAKFLDTDFEVIRKYPPYISCFDDHGALLDIYTEHASGDNQPERAFSIDANGHEVWFRPSAEQCVDLAYYFLRIAGEDAPVWAQAIRRVMAQMDDGGDQ